MLPNTYQRIEYIQSSGTQYININYLDTNTDNGRFVIDYAPTLFGSNYYDYRSGGAFDGARYMLFYGNSANLYFGCGGNDANLNYPLTLNTRYLIDLDIQSGTISGSVNDASVSGTYTGSNHSSQSMFLFALSTYGSATQLSSYKLYSFKLYDNDILVRDLIPVRRKSDSVLGLYDLVNDVFYVNSGTGVFTGGSDVYSVVASVNPADSGSVSGTGEYLTGTSVTLTATPSSDYRFVSWTSNGTIVSTDNPYTFTITDDTSLVANFELNECTLNLSVSPQDSGYINIGWKAQFPNGLRSAGSVYDEINETKAIKRVGDIDLGSLTWTYVGSGNTLRFDTDITDLLIPESQAITVNAICPNYVAKPWTYVGSNDTGYFACYIASNNTRHFIVRDTNYTDATTFKNAMNGVKLYYELATPVETDITFDYSYDIVNGGTESVNSSVPIIADILYPSGLKTDQTFISRQTTEDGIAKVKRIKGNTQVINGELVSFDGTEITTIGKNWCDNDQSFTGITWASRSLENLLLPLVNNLDVGNYVVSMDFTLTTRNDTSDASKYGLFFANPNGVITRKDAWGTSDVGATQRYSLPIAITNSLKGNFANIYVYGCGIDGVGATGIATVSNIQLELGTQATDYEPYQSNSYPIYIGYDNASFVFDGGTEITVEAINTTRTFSNWSVGGSVVSTSNPYTFTITNNTNLVAVFINVIAVNIYGAGVVSGAGAYQDSDTCTLVATPHNSNGFRFYKENDTILSSNTSYSFTITGSRNIDAFFTGIFSNIRLRGNKIK